MPDERGTKGLVRVLAEGVAACLVDAGVVFLVEDRIGARRRNALPQLGRLSCQVVAADCQLVGEIGQMRLDAKAKGEAGRIKRRLGVAVIANDKQQAVVIEQVSQPLTCPRLLRNMRSKNRCVCLHSLDEFVSFV